MTQHQTHAAEPMPEDDVVDAVIETDDDLDQQVDDPLLTEIADLKDRLLRAVAETENMRRRAERDKVDISKFAVSKFAGDLLSVVDNLRRALDALPADAQEKLDDKVRAVLSGVDVTERELLRVLERNGVQKIKIDLGNEVFDPNRHEVMFEIDDATKLKGTILHVMQDGYVIQDRLLRPTQIGVAKGGTDASGLDQKV
jgi:molecular chaperone GrpE